MSSGKLLLDTNIVIALFAGESTVIRKLRDAESVFLSAIVIGELCYGAQLSARRESNLAKIRELSATLPVLSCDVPVASQYGELKKLLKERGRSVPENDLWIAATARQYRLTVATRDAHFREIPTLSFAIW